MNFRSFFRREEKKVGSTGAGMNVTFNGPCPFCGKMIEESATDPCGITVTTRHGKWQTWSCHAECFKEKMVANPYLDISPMHF